MAKSPMGAHAADRTSTWPRLVAAFVGAATAALGLWAMAAPQSFFDTVATFEPYNQHLLQDIGAFQLGLGAVLLLALTGRDVLSVALLGVGIGSAAHTVSHIIGIDLGGRPASDIPLFAVVSVLLMAAGLARWNAR